MPKKRCTRFPIPKNCPGGNKVSNPEENRLEYEERKDRLRAVLMNRRAKATNATIESAPRDDDTIESAPQDDLNDMSNHGNEPKP